MRTSELLSAETHADEKVAGLLLKFHVRRNRNLFGIGAVFGIIAFTYSWYLMHALRSRSVGLNMYGDRFPSGVPYMPFSVSEMIWDRQNSQGEIFMGFAVIAAFCQLMSWYTYFLSNVMVPRASAIPCFPRIPLSMNTARAVIPPIGMLLVVFCNVRAPNYDTSLIGRVMIIHNGGATGMLVSYFYFELLIVSGLVKTLSPLGPKEKRLRTACVVLGVLGLLGFVFFGQINLDKFGWCCMDVYLPVNQTVCDIAAKNGAYEVEMENKKLMQLAMQYPEEPYPVFRGLYNSAFAAGLFVKQACFFCEVLAGLCMLISMLVILYTSDSHPEVSANELLNRLET
eukprot:TRINITY_DN42767_c0_g1_i1.p1 TRINITY_DN42767_c0_g1~~TRINITY_DN42767_c0_g1_i1.p1  ORF type:complete len:352 (-),score=45.15 TRINITY_DN42767_c0_g1_i1:34-1056(-)